MNTKTIFAAVALMISAFCPVAFSQTYTLGYDTTQYNTNAGGIVDAVVVLTEEVTGAEVSRLAAGGNNGLFSYSLGIDYSVFSGSAGSTFNSVVLDPLFVGGFSGSGEDVTDDPGVVSFEGTENFASNDSDGENGVGGTMVATDIYEIALATVRFNAGAAGSRTTLTLQEHVSPAANPFLFSDGIAPEINFTASEIFVANAVPEPSSAGVLALLAGVGILRRRRN